MNFPVEILLVEDNPHDVKLTLNAFARHKLANPIHVARDGEEALDFLFGRGPHAGRTVHDLPRLILLDLKLPKVDGLEVLRQVKADPRLQSLLVVILTASMEERDFIQGCQLGVSGYMVKPVDFEKFIESVRLLGMYWRLINPPPVPVPLPATLCAR